MLKEKHNFIIAMDDYANISGCNIYNLCLFHFYFEISGLNSHYLSQLVTKLGRVKYHLSGNYVEKNRKKKHRKKQRKKESAWALATTSDFLMRW